MKYGFLKVAAAAPDIKVADCRYNGESSLKVMKACAAQGVKLLVLPELGLTGYTCGDLFLHSTLIDGALQALLSLCEKSKDLPMMTIVGLPFSFQGALYNCAAVLYGGKILGMVPKTNLPNYTEFYEQRHFVPAPLEESFVPIGDADVPFGSKLLFTCNQMPAFKLAVEICEDVWVSSPPSIGHAKAGATVIANLSASNEVIGKDSYRRQLISSQSAKLIAGYLYADAGKGESTQDLVFSGHHLIAQNGALVAENKPFAAGIAMGDLDLAYLSHERQRTTTWAPDDDKDYLLVPFSMPLSETVLSLPVPRNPFVPDDPSRLAERCEMILTIQSDGLRKRIAHTNAGGVVVGISGGLDSTLALLVSTRAMKDLGRPAGDVVAVTMPCFGTTKRTKSNAVQLCQSLGVTFREVDITKSVLQHFKDLGHDENDHSVLFENAQARERTQVLMDISHQCKGFVVGTGDLSELALGWATYNGDHMSMYGVNASIPKTLVRYLVRYYALHVQEDALKDILFDILDTPVSPELLPPKDGVIAQCTEELVGPYELHDFFLYYMLRRGFPPKKIEHLANLAWEDVYSRETIHKWLKIFVTRFFSQQFKRSCLPDGPKVGTVTLSPRGDWRMPSDASAALWLADLED